MLASTCTSNKVTGVTRAVIKRTCAKFAMAEHRPVTEIQFDGSEIPGKSKACQDSEEKKIYIYRERESRHRSFVVESKLIFDVCFGLESYRSAIRSGAI